MARMKAEGGRMKPRRKAKGGRRKEKAVQVILHPSSFILR
jgi:uncharacterized protein Veg